jgi:hypothetical protein
LPPGNIPLLTGELGVLGTLDFDFTPAGARRR